MKKVMSKGKIILNSTQTSNITLVSSENGQTNIIMKAPVIINGGLNSALINGVQVMSTNGSLDCTHVSGVGSIEVLGGHTLNAISKDTTIEEIIVTNGTINFDNDISFGHFAVAAPVFDVAGAAPVFDVVGAAPIFDVVGADINIATTDLGLFGKYDFTLQSNMLSSQNNQDVQQSRFSGTKITIGSQGRLNLTGSELPIEEIIMSDGAQLQCVVNNNQYTLDSTRDVKLDSKDLKQLIKVTEFMYDKFGDQKDIIINYDDIADLKIYHRLCNKIGKNSVQNFIESKEALVDIYSVEENAKIIESIDKMLVNSLLINSIFPEHQVIDFDNIDKLINDNYFELVGIAKNPLEKGFYGKFGVATEILKEISSFLDLNDVTAQTILPEEGIGVTGNTEENIL